MIRTRHLLTALIIFEDLGHHSLLLEAFDFSLHRLPLTKTLFLVFLLLSLSFSVLPLLLTALFLFELLFLACEFAESDLLEALEAGDFSPLLLQLPLHVPYRLLELRQQPLLEGLFLTLELESVLLMQRFFCLG